MKEIILQKSNFRCRENIYICRPLRRLRRLAVEYVKKYSANKLTLLEIIMENPGLRFKKNLTTNRKHILMFIDMSYVYDLS